MKLLSEYAGQRILFFQPSVWKRFHELKVNDELYGTFEEKGFFRSIKWNITIDGKKWETYRKGFWRRDVCIREVGYELPFAELNREGLRSKWTLNLPKGEKLSIIPHLFRGNCEIKNEMEECLVRIKPKAAFKDKAEVLIEKKSDIIDKYPWAVVLGYIVMMQLRHQAAHAAH
jgi:hypothetical protein